MGARRGDSLLRRLAPVMSLHEPTTSSGSPLLS
jgi:hypothetical protein